MTDYRVYDVFTNRPYAGNQLAVIPDATQLPEADLQAIAREFNFSETTFVTPPRDASHSARVRIFTPTMEVPFAGHPTIGTATCLYDMGYGADLVLELGVGPIACTCSADGAAFDTQTPLARIATPDPTLIARALSLPPDAIFHQTHAPIMAGVGLPFVMVELADRATLAAANPVTDVFAEGAARYPSELDFAIYAYTRNGDHIDARMFAPLDNIPEDPATGSAAAALTALLRQQLSLDQALTITQGEDMGRRSDIRARSQGGRITIMGQAVLTMQGKLIR